MRSIGEWLSLRSSVIRIVVDGGVNDPDLTEVDLSRFSKLRTLEIGDNCFGFVVAFKLVGLSKLNRVIIGKHCFTYHTDNTQTCRFCVKECPKLKVLKIGPCSFSHYSVCEIEKVDALEVMEIGYLNKISDNFDHASLELKSEFILNA